ncbi:nucleotidyltransferase [Kitasatospora sp. NPDC049285]|uniref:nucleotidyltransferase n=1 Tax=Kitasatospora sp. NPDC049285 TaxID=3157096 RepID=UPI003425AE6C
MPTNDAPAAALLDAFTARLRAAVPLRALWAHGSLAHGDYRHGRSDLDLIAVLPAEADPRQREELTQLHRQLIDADPDAAKLHCSYLPERGLDDAGRPYFTFAQGEPMDRPVTPISRRELLHGGLVLTGPAPDTLLPPVGDAELHDHIRADLRDYLLPITAKPEPWQQDIWVDHGPITAARATITLRDGRLVTKRAAIDELPLLGAPQSLIDDIAARRYATPLPLTPAARTERADAARRFTRTAIERALQG